MRVNWPSLAVRTWQGALYSRSQEYWVGEHDDALEAAEGRPLHELRGIIIGQAAEIEGLLLYIGSEIRARHTEPLPKRHKRRGAGGALQDLRMLLKVLQLDEQLSGKLDHIGRVIQRRNRLVHGRIHVGFSRLSEQAPLEPVITLLFENDPDDDQPQAGDDEDYECGEAELTRYLQEAHQALEAGLDLWESVEQVLPEKELEELPAEAARRVALG